MQINRVGLFQMKNNNLRRPLFTKLLGRYVTRLLMFFLLGPLSTHYGNATSVISVTLDEMLLASEIVFEGKVISIDTRAADNGRGMIHTYITFEIIDIVKGQYDGETITLSFLGGTIGDRTLAVGDMQIPVMNEEGIYFVETTGRAQVHPFYGWDQGHFIITEDAGGVQRVSTNKGKPIFGVDQRPLGSVSGLSNKQARGLILKAGNQNSPQVAVEQFKATLKKMLEGD